MAFAFIDRIIARMEAPPFTVPPLSTGRLAEIVAAVERDGKWVCHVEWRMSTVTSSLIERTGEAGHRAYKVRVDCDYLLEAHCPTVARAAEIAHVYETVILQLWKKFGWPSWASRTMLEPPP